MIGTITTTIQPPAVNLVIAMTENTTPVVIAPTVLMAAAVLQRGSSFSRYQ
jgi:hypothetical protein